MLLFDKRVHTSTKVFIVLFAFFGLWNAFDALAYHDVFSLVITFLMAVCFLGSIKDAHGDIESYDRTKLTGEPNE